MAFGGLAAAPARGYWLLVAAVAFELAGVLLDEAYHQPGPHESTQPRRRTTALASAAVLMVLGAASGEAAHAPGMTLALAVATVVYGTLPTGMLAFIDRGLCRGLALSMPLAIAPRVVPLAIASALVLTTYSAILAYLRDASAARRPALIGLAMLTVATAVALSGTPSPFFGGVFFFAVIVWGSTLFAPLWMGAEGYTARRVLGDGVSLIPLLDATFVAASGSVPSAILTAALTLPVLSGRRAHSAG